MEYISSFLEYCLALEIFGTDLLIFKSYLESLKIEIKIDPPSLSWRHL